MESKQIIEAESWKNGHCKVKTIFYQGLYSSQTQAAKYVHPEEGFIATTGEKVHCPKGLDLIQDLYIGKELSEIHPMDNSWISIFHPLKAFNYLWSYISNRGYGFQIIDNSDDQENKNKNKNKKNKTLKSHHIDYFQFNFGQEGDVQNHREKYEKCLEEHPDHDFILWGVSKGAATTLNALSKNDYDLSKIKMVILEGCYDAIENVFETWDSFYGRMILRALPYLPIQYKSDPEWDPVSNLDNLPMEVPIIFISSKVDAIVPYECTKRLVDKLREHGHKHVHFLELDNSSHPRYMFDCPDDRQKYLEFIHEIYEKYELPYKEEYLTGKEKSESE